MFVQHTDMENGLEESDASFMQASSEIDDLLPTTVRFYPMITNESLPYLMISDYPSEAYQAVTAESAIETP
jgi:hypothetical protein